MILALLLSCEEQPAKQDEPSALIGSWKLSSISCSEEIAVSSDQTLVDQSVPASGYIQVVGEREIRLSEVTYKSYWAEDKIIISTFVPDSVGNYPGTYYQLSLIYFSEFEPFDTIAYFEINPGLHTDWYEAPITYCHDRQLNQIHIDSTVLYFNPFWNRMDSSRTISVFGTIQNQSLPVSSSEPYEYNFQLDSLTEDGVSWIKFDANGSCQFLESSSTSDSTRLIPDTLEWILDADSLLITANDNSISDNWIVGSHSFRVSNDSLMIRVSRESEEDDWFSLRYLEGEFGFEDNSLIYHKEVQTRFYVRENQE